VESLLRPPLFEVARPPIPQPPDALIGRHAAVAEIERLLRGPARCVTLVGPPGIGKTRLALAIAHRLDKELAAGVWWVPLLDATKPEDVGRRLQRALDIREESGVDPVPSAVARLGRQVALLVFDNFEHVVDARALVSGIVSATPNVAVLVTSREPLGILAEHVVGVPGLAVPDAVSLFVARAQMARAGFHLTDGNRPDVEAACARLDGIPLAIVLAAGAVRTVDPAGLVRRLAVGADPSAGAPLPGPAGGLAPGPADMPSHHRTLSEAIASSWNLLGEEARRLLASAAVCSGGFTAEAAAAVEGCGLHAAWQLLDELARKSLAEARPAPSTASHSSG